MKSKIVILLLYLGVAFINAALAVEDVEYNIIVPDYIDVEKNLTISNILSYADVTGAYDAASWGLDWGDIRTPYKWKVNTENGDKIIGFERYETVSTEPLIITFFRTVTEQTGSHTETRYIELQQPQTTGIRGIPMAAGIQATGWWNSAWQYKIDNQIPDGSRPYQLSLTISNSAGTNNASHVFLNGLAKNDLSDIRFTLDNAIELPYWREKPETGKVWVRIPDNGVVNLYFGNPSATDSSNGKSTFEFFDDFTSLDLGANPVLRPDQGWETGGYLRWGTIAYSNGMYYIYYTTGSSPASDIGRAKSTDLISWTKSTNNPVINDRIGPSLLKELDGKTPVLYNNKYWMLTMKSDGSAIELRSASTLDSNTWTLVNSNLIPKVPGTWYADYLYTTSFTRENGNYYIVMEAGTPGKVWNVGYLKASSPDGTYIDGGILLSPTLSWEGIGILDPEMRKFDNTYYLFYTGNDAAPYYQNSYATKISSLGGKYTKSQIKLTPAGQTYPAILKKDQFYYILTDDQPSKNPGKSLFRRKDLNGPFGSPFEWNKNGAPTISGTEVLINENGEFLRSSSNFLYKAMKIRAKYAPQTPAVNNKYQYFGFVASSAADETPSEMYFGSEEDLKTISGNSLISKNTSIYNQDYFGSYHNYEILWRKGEAKFIIDDALKATHTTSVADASLPLGIYDYTTAANLTVDWVFVRNYVSPEPEWAGWSPDIPQTGISNSLSLSVDAGAKETTPGVNATYTLSLRNTGSLSDNYSIAVNNPNDAIYGLNITLPVMLPAEAIQIFTLNVTNASSGIFRVKVIANSTNDPRKTAYVNTTTTVAGKGVYLTNISPLIKQTITGTNATYILDLNNNGTAIDTYDVAIVNINKAKAVLNLSSVTLNPGASKIFSLNVTNLTVGTFNVTVIVTSRGDPSKVGSINTTTYVQSSSPINSTYYSGHVTVKNNITANAFVRVYGADGIEVANATSNATGVYRLYVPWDQPIPGDEGAISNEIITFRVNGTLATLGGTPATSRIIDAPGSSIILNLDLPDIEPPVITLFYPNNNSTISIFDRVISGSITDDSSINAHLYINGGLNYTWTTKGNFSWIANYSGGKKTMNITANDTYGNSHTIIIVFQVLPSVEVTNKNINNNSQLNITANATTGVDLVLTTGNNSANVRVTINASINASDFNTSNIVNGLGRYVDINANGDTDNLTGVKLTLFYNHAELDKNGNGVTTDVGDLDENSLTLYWYWDNTTGNPWLPLTTGVDYSGKLDKANKSGPKVSSIMRNDTGNYLSVSMNHFSIYTIAGTIIPTPSNGGGGSSGSSSSGSSGGGGGGASGENYNNIDVVEKYDMQISKDALTSYRFTHTKNPIMFVNITGNTSLGLITTSIEVLKNTSTLVKVLPEGLVYKNVNIWVGTSGFATPKNIKQALIKFRIDNAWMNANGISAGNVVLMKWDGKAWINLDTKVLSKDDTNSYFEGWTNSFSPFAIVAKTAAAPQPTVTTNRAGTPAITATGIPAPQSMSWNWLLYLLALIIIGAVAYVYTIRKK